MEADWELAKSELMDRDRWMIEFIRSTGSAASRNANGEDAWCNRSDEKISLLTSSVLMLFRQKLEKIRCSRMCVGYLLNSIKFSYKSIYHNVIFLYLYYKIEDISTKILIRHLCLNWFLSLLQVIRI